MDIVERLLALVGINRSPYPAGVLCVMRSLQKDPEAMVNVELCRGVPFWSDEGFDEIVMGCLHAKNERGDDLFLYRLYLLTGKQHEGVDYQRCEASWNYLKRHCPTWPGFDGTRCDPVRGPEIMILIARTYEDL